MFTPELARRAPFLGGNMLAIYARSRSLLAVMAIFVLVAMSFRGGEVGGAAAVVGPVPAVRLSGGEKCFGATGRCMHGIFLGYWQAHGGLDRFGYPVTDELAEGGRTVQYTETPN